MKVKMIGIGAAGNKACITAVEEKVISLENVLLINSTSKDIPNDWSGKVHCFDSQRGGCGKERSMAKKLAISELQGGILDLDKFISADGGTELVVLVASTEGGTGSGSLPIIAKYINEVLGVNVHIFAFTGFEEDVRGLRNTTEFFTEMEETFTVQILQNTKYMSECNNNKLKAEKKANSDFAMKIAVLAGNILRDSEHNIDATDLFKVSTTSGFMIVEFANFSKLKNRDQFRKMVIDMIDNSKSIDINETTQKKLAVMINITNSSTDIIDYNDILIERYGQAYEKFEHIQHEESMDEFFAIISAGIKIPTKEIEDIYNKYMLLNSSTDKRQDEFFSKGFRFDEGDKMFDLAPKSRTNKSSFFNNINSDKSENTIVKNESADY